MLRILEFICINQSPMFGRISFVLVTAQFLELICISRNWRSPKKFKPTKNGSQAPFHKPVQLAKNKMSWAKISPSPRLQSSRSPQNKKLAKIKKSKAAVVTILIFEYIIILYFFNLSLCGTILIYYYYKIFDSIDLIF